MQHAFIEWDEGWVYLLAGLVPALVVIAAAWLVRAALKLKDRVI
jgi:hypothetical protein